jgi:hypothetical protein
MLIDERLHTELPGIAPMSASETIIVQGSKIRDFRLQSHQSRKINDKFGSGRQEIVTAHAVGLRKELTITSYDQFPGVLVLSARYTRPAVAISRRSVSKLGRIGLRFIRIGETHAIRKDGRIYYSFYARAFDGKDELSGVENRKYRIQNYVNGRGTVSGSKATLGGTFQKHLLLQATPE